MVIYFLKFFSNSSKMYEIQMLPFITFPLLFCLSFLLWNYLHKSAPNKNFPPSPPKLPIIGNLHQLSQLPHQDLHSLARKLGPLMLIHFGSVPVLVASSADTSSAIMNAHDLTFCSRPQYKAFRKLFYGCRDVSFAPYGEYWRQMKSVYILHLLSVKRVQSFRPIREEETALFVERVEESVGPVNLSEMFGEFTNDVICRSAFGEKFRESEKGKKLVWLSREFLVLLGSISLGDFIPWLGWIDRVSGLDKRLDRAAKEMDEFLNGVIDERIEAIKGANLSEKGGENFVDIMLEIYSEEKDGVSISREGIKALVLDVLLGGTDTISTTLEWAMTELLRHPAKLEKLQKEVREIVKGNQHITNEDISQMHYLKAVIKETLRYHPPLPLLVPRMASKDVTINGFNVSAGTVAMINTWTISRDEAIWNDAEKFQPERFLNSGIDFKGTDFKFVPFGAGRRRCPGIAYGEATTEFMLANIVHKFNWKLPGEAKGGNLDITESPGMAVRRATPLYAVAFKSA